MYQAAWQQTSYRFADLKELMAKATPLRSGDVLAGIAAESAEENVAAKMALADVPLDSVPQRGADPLRERRRHPADHRHATTRRPLQPVAHLTVGDVPRLAARARRATTEVLAALGAGHHAGDGRGGLPRSCATRI